MRQNRYLYPKINDMPKMIPFLLFVSIIISNSTYSQSFSCDSVQISNVNYTPDSLNQISLMASNANLDIISYPGFVLLNDIGDTMAKEVVNYFGIGYFPQPHFLQVYQPISNPFAGTIELHSMFYDSLICIFPFILDTTLYSSNKQLESISVYPNPTTEMIYISSSEMAFDFKILDINGNLLFQNNKSALKHELNVAAYAKGNYIILINNVQTYQFIKK